MKKSNLLFWLILISGLVIGGLIGSLCEKVPFLYWLNYGKSVGLTSPLVLDLSFFSLTLGFTFSLTVAGIIGMAIAIFIYKKM